LHVGLPELFGNREQLVSVCQNLITNAIKFRTSAPPLIRIAAKRREAEWVLSVSDNGIGIDPQYHQRIFGLFKRLHGPRVEGSGLGLAISRQIVERHGGRIWVESEEGRGATFYFTIPIPGADSDPAHQAMAKVPEADSRTRAAGI
jgi:signal transduction histidine kinase